LRQKEKKEEKVLKSAQDTYDDLLELAKLSGTNVSV
jgi:hypothetical protein